MDRASPWRSRGYLPHLDLARATQHVVFGLADAVPSQAAERLRQVPTSARLAEAERWLDEGHGARWLSRPDVAGLVASALRHFDRDRYDLLAWCVMPTHVHVLAQFDGPQDLVSAVHGWKSFTAHGANRILGRTGRFWAPEYFDRAMRDDRHLQATQDYVECNPVAAGLCAQRAAWPWSSAAFRT